MGNTVGDIQNETARDPNIYSRSFAARPASIFVWKPQVMNKQRMKGEWNCMKKLVGFAALAALLCLPSVPARASTLTNLARAGIASQSTDYSAQGVASRAIDGNRSGLWGDASISHTADNDPAPWWQVDLQSTQPIGHIHFWFREECCFARNDYLRVVVYDSTNTATRTVLWETNNLAWEPGMTPRDIGFDIEPAVNGQVVYVEHLPEQASDLYLCFSEVEVYNQKLISGENYARQGTPTSSSCYTGDCLLYGALQAADGNHFGVSAAFPWGYSAPDDTPEVDPLPWWQVDLAEPETIGGVVLWPRRDRTYERYQNIRLTVADPGGATLYQQMFNVQPSGPKFAVNFVPPLANAKTVKIEATEATPDKFLNLPEVEVLGSLPSAPTATFPTDLQPVSVEESRPATFGPVAAVFDGGIRPEDVSYRWFRNGVEIPNAAGSWMSTYTTPYPVALTNNGDKYKVQVSVPGHGIFSTEVALTVNEDTTAPTLATPAVAVADQVTVTLVYDETLDPSSATNTANYTLSGGPTVGGLALAADGRTVTMVVENVLLGDDLSLSVSGVKDLAGNTLQAVNFSAAIPQTPINYARGGTATQNSNYIESTVASRAIDGNTAGSWGANSIACTANGELGWWEVDLKSTRTIGSVSVWWRTDCCGTRNSHVDLVIYDQADPGTRQELLRLPLTGAEVPPVPTVLKLPNPQAGRVVRLEHTLDTDQNDPNNVQMCLAEVQVFPPPTGLVVTPTPSSWNVYSGDRVFLRSGSDGQTPITTQWLRDGTPIPGASAPELVFTNITSDQAGSYVFMASNSVRVRYSQPALVTVHPRPPMAQNLAARYLFDADTAEIAFDSAPQGPAKTGSHDGVNTGGTWVDSVTDSKNMTRTGVMQFDASIPSQVMVPPHDDLNRPAGTIAFWIKAQPPAAGKTALFDRRGGTNNWGDVIVLHLDSTDSPNKVPDTIFNQAYPSGLNVGGITPVDDDNWRHIAYVYQWRPFGIVSFYVDGKLDAELTRGDPGEWPLDMPLEFGRSHDSYWPPYTGYLDDIHIFNRVLDAAEINQLMTSGVLELAPTLTIRLTGNEVTITWPGSGYILQQNNALNNAAGWADMPNATSGTATVTVPATGNNYYRLKKQ